MYAKMNEDKKYFKTPVKSIGERGDLIWQKTEVMKIIITSARQDLILGKIPRKKRR